MDEAKAQGAIGLFTSKYGERVKVYTMGDFSKENLRRPARRQHRRPQVLQDQEGRKFLRRRAPHQGGHRTVKKRFASPRAHAGRAFGLYGRE